jgi:hypothetical protein
VAWQIDKVALGLVAKRLKLISEKQSRPGGAMEKYGSVTACSRHSIKQFPVSCKRHQSPTQPGSF